MQRQEGFEEDVGHRLQMRRKLLERQFKLPIDAEYSVGRNWAAAL